MTDTTEGPEAELDDLGRARQLIEKTMTHFSSGDRTLWTRDEIDDSLDSLLEVWTILHAHGPPAATPA